MVQTIFSSEFGQSVLLFIFVSVAIFAVLQKSKILGDGKKQVDALVSLAIALIVVSLGYTNGIITQLLQFMVVALVVILIFLLLVGIFFNEGKFDIPDKLKVAFGILIFIAVAIAVIIFSGAGDWLRQFFSTSESGSSIFANAVMIIIIIVVGAIIFFSGGKSEKKN